MFCWTPEMIAFMQAANSRSTYHKDLAALLAPKLACCEYVCDAGCGLGSLSLALSPYIPSITAADVSQPALDVLRQTIRERGIGNIRVLQRDLLGCGAPESYDAMICCFFGRLAEILPLARQSCRKTLILIKKDYNAHRFSLNTQPLRGETAPVAAERLRALRIPFTLDAQELEYGQPFRTLEEAVRFFTIYSKDSDPAAITAQSLLPRLQKTQDAEFPYYLPQKKRLGILTIRMEDLI